MMEDAISIATSKDFTESMSQLKRFSQNTDFSEGQDMGKRLSETLSATFDRSDHLSKSMGQHLTASENYSQMASYVKDNSVRIDESYNNDMWKGFVKYVGGNNREAAYIMNSQEGWAKDIVEDYKQGYLQKMEHKILPHVDAKVATEGGFHNATSHMAKQHAEAVSKMAAPSRETFESERNTLKDTSTLGDVNQNIQSQKKSLQKQSSASESNVKETMHTQDQSLKNEKGKMHQDFKENDAEWIASKAGRAANPFKNLNKTSKKD